MRSATSASLLWLASAAQIVLAVDAVFVTELEIFTLLAPCAKEAVSYNIQYQTVTTRCGSEPSDLQKCICSSSPVFSDVQSKILNDVASSCGTDATQDRSSAGAVISQYCNPTSTITFATPTTNIVQAYITDLAEMSYLPACARSALSEAVMGNISRCPTDAALFAPCVCSKDNVTPRISQTITTSVRYSCSNNEDITAAQDFYHEYCAMNNGTTSFAKPSGPPGDMTYYVTAMPHFKSLNSCAQAAVSSAIQAQTVWYCPPGPQALASCACLKSGMLSKVSSTLTSEVKFQCDNTATAQVTSALEVLDVYCRAAAASTSLKVDESISETIIQTASGPKPSDAAQTSGSAAGDKGGSPSSGESPASDTNSGSSKPSTATIAGAVVGGVLGLALVGLAFFFYRRRQSKKNGHQPLGPGNSNPPGTPELASPYTSSPGGYYAGGAVKELSPQLSSVSPVTELPSGPQTEPVQELPAQQQFPRELAAAEGGGGHAPSPQQHGEGWGQHPQSSNISPMTPPDNQGLGWQSGPVPQAYELDSNIRR